MIETNRKLEQVIEKQFKTEERELAKILLDIFHAQALHNEAHGKSCKGCRAEQKAMKKLKETDIGWFEEMKRNGASVAG